jgi:hypothetical protein
VHFPREAEAPLIGSRFPQPLPTATAQTASEAVKAVEVSQAAGAAPVVANATAASPSLADVRALLVQNKIIPEVLDDFQPSVGIRCVGAFAGGGLWNTWWRRARGL